MSILPENGNPEKNYLASLTEDFLFKVNNKIILF